jgi:hypothetical protein
LSNVAVKPGTIVLPSILFPQWATAFADDRTLCAAMLDRLSYEAGSDRLP